jgi:hypothetical protein
MHAFYQVDDPNGEIEACLGNSWLDGAVHIHSRNSGNSKGGGVSMDPGYMLFYWNMEVAITGGLSLI